MITNTWRMAAGLVVLVAMGAGCQCGQKAGDFSRWMGGKEFSEWIQDHVEGKEVYVSGVEGKLADGRELYRAKVCPAPENTEWYWFWWYGQSESFFRDRMQALTREDCFRLIWAESFLDAGGNPKYQMVFLKIVNVQKPCAGAGNR